MGYINTDIPELRGYDTGVILGNLARIGRRLDAEMGASIAQIYELAEAIGKDAAGDLDTVESILRALAAEPPGPTDEPDPTAPDAPDAPVIAGMTERLGLCQRLILYRALAEGTSQTIAPSPVTQAGTPPATPPIASAAQGRIAYMPNAFADHAYLSFSRRLAATHGGACRAAVFHSFVDACEEVYNGLCEYCILPLEHTADGKLTGFSRLIIKYRLYITAVCDVENHTLTEASVTRFALLRRASDAPVLTFTTDPRPRHLELLHTTATAPSLTDVMVAATFCGLTLRRLDTLPAPERPDAPPPVCVVWDTSKASEADMTVFLTYVALEASEDRVLGMY